MRGLRILGVLAVVSIASTVGAGAAQALEVSQSDDGVVHVIAAPRERNVIDTYYGSLGLIVEERGHAAVTASAPCEVGEFVNTPSKQVRCPDLPSRMDISLGDRPDRLDTRFVTNTPATVDLGDGADRADLEGYLGCEVDGGTGNDHITGCFYGATVDGGEGNDRLAANPYERSGFFNSLDGGEGNDQITGGWAREELLGGPGRDRIDSSTDDRSDQVDCGQDSARRQMTDRLTLDPFDVAVNCEVLIAGRST